MGISPAIILFSNRLIPAAGGKYYQLYKKDADPVLVIGQEEDKCAELADIYETPQGDLKVTALVLASTESRFTNEASNPDATEVSRGIRKALVEIFKQTGGEIAFKTIDNPLPEITTIEEALDAIEISPYIIIKKEKIKDEKALLEALSNIPGVFVVDHGAFYEISLTETPFGNIKTTDPSFKDDSISPQEVLNKYYLAIGRCIAGIGLYK